MQLLKKYLDKNTETNYIFGNMTIAPYYSNKCNYYRVTLSGYGLRSHTIIFCNKTKTAVKFDVIKFNVSNKNFFKVDFDNSTAWGKTDQKLFIDNFFLFSSDSLYFI